MFYLSSELVESVVCPATREQANRGGRVVVQWLLAGRAAGPWRIQHVA